MHKQLNSCFFHRKQKHVDKINVQINGTQMERVEFFNFLGIMLDKNLTWKSHIEMVDKQISKVTVILSRLFPESVLFVLYNSLIESYIYMYIMNYYCGEFMFINLNFCQ